MAALGGAVVEVDAVVDAVVGALEPGRDAASCAGVPSVPPLDEIASIMSPTAAARTSAVAATSRTGFDAIGEDQRDFRPDRIDPNVRAAEVDVRLAARSVLETAVRKASKRNRCESTESRPSVLRRRAARISSTDTATRSTMNHMVEYGIARP
jgi:hypothetical protein